MLCCVPPVLWVGCKPGLFGWLCRKEQLTLIF